MIKSINFITGLSKKTIGCIAKHAKHAKQKIKGNTQIGGPGVIVEIDESKFGKQKYHKAHRVGGIWVLGMVERALCQKLVLIKVKNRKADTLTMLIKKYVMPGSVLYIKTAGKDTPNWVNLQNIHIILYITTLVLLITKQIHIKIQ